MPNAIKYNVSAETLALKKGNFWIGTGDVSKGPTSSTGYYNGITPPTGGYTIYLNKANNGPSIYTVTSDAQLIALTNQIAGTTYTTISQCLTYYAGQTDKMVLNRNYEGIVTNGLILNLDAGFIPSYPIAGTTWYDISGGNNNATMYNGLTFNSGGWMDFDGSDDYCGISYNSGNMSDWSTGQTIIIWEYHTFNDGSRRNFWNQAYGGAGTWTHEGGSVINYYYGNSGYNGNPYTSLQSLTTPTGGWNMLVTTRDPSQVKWYQNNINTGTMSNPYGVLTSTTSDITIGNGYTGQPWAGRMAIIQAYNRALTAAEISQNYNAQKSRFGL
jgi:hypothetical protein